MKSLSIAWKDFKIHFFDSKSILLMVFMPLVITALLGSALSAVLNGEVHFPLSKVAVYQPDADLISRHFVDMLKSEELQEFIMLIEVQSRQK